MPIEGLMWDMGNVIINFDIPAANRILAAHCEKSEEEVNTVLYGLSGKDGTYNKGVGEDFYHGRESFEKFYQRVKKALDLNVGLSEFEKIWSGVLTSPNRIIIKFIHRVNKYFSQCVISSTNDVQWDEMNRLSAIGSFPTIEELLGSDRIVRTYKVGLSKPSEEIFEAGRRSIGNIPRKNVIYIDDVAKYVAAAKSLGYQGVVFDVGNQSSQVQCIYDILKLGVEL